jgi:hypothetical protein
MAKMSIALAVDDTYTTQTKELKESISQISGTRTKTSLK